MLQGELSSFDQFGNVALADCSERLTSGRHVADLYLGPVIFRGDAIAMLGAHERDCGEATTLNEVVRARIEDAAQRQERTVQLAGLELQKCLTTGRNISESLRSTLPQFTTIHDLIARPTGDGGHRLAAHLIGRVEAPTLQD